MEKERQIAIANNVLTGIENSLEALAFEGKVCAKVGDEAGLERIKKQAMELQKKVDAAHEIIKELAEPVKKGKK